MKLMQTNPVIMFRVLTPLILIVAFVPWPSLALLALDHVTKNMNFGGSHNNTSSNAAISEVRFLKLPSSSTEIRYYYCRNHALVCFKTTEADFVKLASQEAALQEIAAPAYYVSDGYGDPMKSPIGNYSSTYARSGLEARTSEPDGGGIHFVYDRDRGTAYMEYRSW